MPRAARELPEHRRATQAAKGAFAADLVDRVQKRFAQTGEAQLMFATVGFVPLLLVTLEEMRAMKEERAAPRQEEAS